MLKFTCPCCGYRTLDEPPGNWDVCPICYWEDDPVQLLNPAYKGGANPLSLIECQANFADFGACERRFLDSVRPLEVSDERDSEWRPAKESDWKRALTPRELFYDASGGLETVYYWKSTDD